MSENLEKFGTILLDADLDVGVSLENLNNRIKELSSSKKLDTLTVAINVTGIDTLKEDLKTVLQDVKEINDISSKMSLGSGRTTRRSSGNGGGNGGGGGSGRSSGSGSSSDSGLTPAIRARRILLKSIDTDYRKLESRIIKSSESALKVAGTLSSIEKSRTVLSREARSTDYNVVNRAIGRRQSDLKTFTETFNQQFPLSFESLNKESAMVKWADRLRSGFSSAGKALQSTFAPDTDEFKQLKRSIDDSIESLRQLRTETNEQKYGKSLEDLQDTLYIINDDIKNAKEAKRGIPTTSAQPSFEDLNKNSPLVIDAKQLRSKFTSLNRQLLSIPSDTEGYSSLNDSIKNSLSSLEQLKHETNEEEYGKSLQPLKQTLIETEAQIKKINESIREAKSGSLSSSVLSDEAKKLLNRANSLDRTVDSSVPVNLASGQYNELKDKLARIKNEIIEIDKISDIDVKNAEIKGLVVSLQEVGKETRSITSSLRRLDSFDSQIDSAFYARSLDSGSRVYEELFRNSDINTVYEEAKAKVESLRASKLPIEQSDIETLNSYVRQINSIQTAVQKTFDIVTKGADLREILGNDKTLSAYKDLVIKTEDIKNLFNGDNMQSIISGGKLLSVETETLQAGWHSVTQEIQLANGQIVKLNMGVNNSTGEVKVLNNEMRNVTTGFAGFFNEFRTSFSNLFRYFLNSGIITRFFKSFKQGISDITAVDDAIRELKKVTDETDATYQKFAKSANSVAVALGHSTESVISSTADFAKLGYSFEDAQTLAKNATIYSNVGDMDIDSATQSMVSTMKAFGIETKNSMQILDAFNEVGNNFSISSAGIGEALQRSASALAEGGNTLNESIGLITASNTVLQDPDTVGTAMKTLSLRLRGVDDETGQLIPKMREFVKMYSGGVDIMENDITFKSTVQILRELASVWDDLTDVNRAGLLEKIAGQRQGNAVAAILNNFEDVEAAITTATNSYGSAEKEQARYMDSVTAKTNEFKETVKGFWLELINPDQLKVATGIGTSIISSIQGATKEFGSLTTIIVAMFDVIILKTKNTFSNIVAAFKSARTVAQEAGKSFSLGSFFGGLGVGGWVAIGATVVTTIFNVVGAIKQANEARRQALIDSANKLKQDADQIDSYKERVAELQGVLQNNTSTYDDIKRAKEELISIQDALYEKYGNEAEGIDLVNGKLQTQLDLIDDLSTNAYTEWLMENKNQGKDALSKIEDYEATIDVAGVTKIPDSAKNIFESNGWNVSPFDAKASKTGNANQIRESIVKINTELEELKKTSNDIALPIINRLQSELSSGLTGVKETIESYSGVASRYIEATVFSNKDLLENYRNFEDIVNKYNNAIANSNLSEAEKAKDELREVASIVTDNMTDAGLGRIYNEPFEDLLSQMDVAGEKALKLENIVKSVGAKAFEGLSNKDLYDGLGGEAFSEIADQASKLGFSVEDVIDKMTELGVVANDSLKLDSSNSILYKLKEIVSDTSDEGSDLQKKLTSAIEAVTEEWRLGTQAAQDSLDVINEILGLNLTLDGTGVIETLNLIDAYVDGGIDGFQNYLNAAVKALGVKPDPKNIENTINNLIAMLGSLTGAAATAGTTIMAALSSMGAVTETYKYELKPNYQALADKVGMEGIPSNAFVKVPTGYKVNQDWLKQFNTVSNVNTGGGSGGGGSTPSPYEYDISAYEKQQKALESLEYQLEKNEAAEAAAGENMVELLAIYEKRADILEKQRQAYSDLISAQTEVFNNEAKLLKEKYGIDLVFDPETGKLVVEDYGLIKKAIGSTNEEVKKNAEAAEKALSSTLELGQTILDNSLAYDNLTSKIKENTKAIEENNAAAQQAKFKELFEELQQNYLNQIGYVIEDLKFALDNDSVIETLDKEIEALQKKLDTLDETNESEKKALELEKQKEAYENAKRQRTNLIYRKGQGFVWEADPTKVKDESDKLADKIKENERYSLELQLKNLQTLRDERKKFYQDQIDAIQKLYDRQSYLIGVMGRDTPTTLAEITKKFEEFGINSSANLATVCGWASSLKAELDALNNTHLNPISISLDGFNNGIIYPDGEGDIPIVDEATWEIPMHSTGTLKARKGLSIVGENGPELRVLGDGDGIIPSEITKNLWEIGKLSSSGLINSLANKLKPLVSNGNSFSVGEVHLHEVKDGQDFCRKLINELPIATQQILYRRR
mgnify:CR=1 FL=1